jgi:hypothetical protein
MHYFSCWGGTDTNSTKSTLGLVTPNLCFASGGICGLCSAFLCDRGTNHQRTIFHVWVIWTSTPAIQPHLHIIRTLVRSHYFSSLGGTGTDSTKTHRDTLRRTYVFASIGICGSCSAFQCIRGAKRQHTIFHARVRPVWIQQCVCQDKLHQTSVFASSGIRGSHSAFWCVRCVKRRCTIFYARVGPLWFP